MEDPQTRQYTWVRVRENQVSAARLGRFYISKKLIDRTLSADIIPVDVTDHHLLVINLNTIPSQRFNTGVSITSYYRTCYSKPELGVLLAQMENSKI